MTEQLHEVLKNKKTPPSLSRKFVKYEPLNFARIERQSKRLADYIEDHFEDLAQILLEYESYEVVEDETSRVLDLLRNLKENKKYFVLRVGEVAAFLPRNQPLYALMCFVVVPSFMASAVHFRIPHSMRHFFPKLLRFLNLQGLFPNIIVSDKQRSDFLRERSALRVNPNTKENIPVTDVVIFTGTPSHADQLRSIFDKRTLFISNGAGHNPLIVTESANLSKAVEAVLVLQLYNQGQDCAAPNSILVHKDVLAAFLNILRNRLQSVKVGRYSDRSCRIGPISDPQDLVRIENFLIEQRAWIDKSTPGTIRSREAILEPTIICKPLREGGNFNEIFAPVIFVQEYESDPELACYFEDSQYAQNAMYISVYGKSEYIENLIGRSIEGKVLHDKKSVLHNTHLHAHGQERGTKPYGGYGSGASSLSINERTFSKPTLPQRDIYEWIVKPFFNDKSFKDNKSSLGHFTEVHQKNVDKLLRLKVSTPTQTQKATTGITYIDLEAYKVNTKDLRYVEADPEKMYYLLEKPNLEYIAKLNLKDIDMIRALRTKLLNKSLTTFEKFHNELYGLSVELTTSTTSNRIYQRVFFQHVYELLLGKKFGPRLSLFLWQTNSKKILELLDI
ncbi:MAG: aldehyde dehydrogenase family protein [Patescibacteria group bacterium]